MIQKPQYLYHGSPIGGIKILEPRKVTTPGILGKNVNAAVYATDIFSYAIAFGFLWDSSEGIDFEERGEKALLIVPKDKKYKLMEKVYIYKVLSHDFELIENASPVGHNYWTHKPIEVESVIEYSNIIEAMEKNGCEIRYI